MVRSRAYVPPERGWPERRDQTWPVQLLKAIGPKAYVLKVSMICIVMFLLQIACGQAVADAVDVG